MSFFFSPTSFLWCLSRFYFLDSVGADIYILNKIRSTLCFDSFRDHSLCAFFFFFCSFSPFATPFF